MDPAHRNCFQLPRLPQTQRCWGCSFWCRLSTLTFASLPNCTLSSRKRKKFKNTRLALLVYLTPTEPKNFRHENQGEYRDESRPVHTQHYNSYHTANSTSTGAQQSQAHRKRQMQGGTRLKSRTYLPFMRKLPTACDSLSLIVSSFATAFRVMRRSSEASGLLFLRQGFPFMVLMPPLPLQRQVSAHGCQPP